MRAGIPRLRALNGKRSEAKVQHCITCAKPVRNGTVHALGNCPTWSSHRDKFKAAAGFTSVNTPLEVTLAVLKCSPPHPAFSLAVLLADAVDAAAEEFWRG